MAPQTQRSQCPIRRTFLTTLCTGFGTSEVATAVIEGYDVTVVLNPAADLRGSLGRLLAYIHAEGEDVGAALLAIGLARVYVEGDASREEQYLEIQRQARAQRQGLWECESAQPRQETTEDQEECDPAYPAVCIPFPPPDLDCGQITHRRFKVLAPDPHRFDGDKDGVGCES